MKNIILIVLDGYGLAPPGPGNAVTLANPQHITAFMYSYPNTTLKASGEAVGLPSGDVGSTQVGHINMGAGRIVYQDLPRINMSIADGSFYSTEKFMEGLNHIKKTGGKLHLLGLVGEGVVHSSVDHLYALLNFAKQNNVSNLYLHAITDGRDSPPRAAETILTRVQEKMVELQIGRIASIMGRYWAMDRDHRWERTQKAYEALTRGGTPVNSFQEAIQNAYGKSQTDEFIEPASIVEGGKPIALIQEGDAVIFFNYRIDRPRQLTKAFVLDNFEKDANTSLAFDPYAVKYYKTHAPQAGALGTPFARGQKLENLFFITMTEYEKDLPSQVAFPPGEVRMPFAKVLAEQNIAQLRITESEKERFVTFYFNGQREQAFPNEDRLIIPSPKVATYDQQPEMSAHELTQTIVNKVTERKYGFILVNFPNTDMVGHTGNLEASMKAVLTVDECVNTIANAGLTQGYTVVVTADHGNVEQKINPQTGGISTEHTDNPVPFIVIDREYYGKGGKLQSGILADIAPTLLKLMGIQKPADMTGRDLLEEVTI